VRYGIDLDGVVVDMHKGLADLINTIWPGRIPTGAEYPPEWDLTSLGLSQGELGVVWSKVRATLNWWLSLPAWPRNVQAVFRHRLQHPEDEIFYVTARSTDTKGLPIMHQSQRWLEMCGIGGVGTAVIVVPVDTRKVDVYEELDIAYAIDDSLDVVNEGSHIIYLLNRKWNVTGRSKGLNVVKDLDEFFSVTRRDNANTIGR
jgi:uncharacterized HAD superfamily protein